MSTPPDIVTRIFDTLGGQAAVGRILRVIPSTASEMKRRKRIPPEYWPAIVTAAHAAGHTFITYEALALHHALVRGRFVPGPSDLPAVASSVL